MILKVFFNTLFLAVSVFVASCVVSWWSAGGQLNELKAAAGPKGWRGSIVLL